jgi:putative endonuclease
MGKGGYVYITCGLNHHALYTGVTSLIGARPRQHKEKFYPGSFSARYNCGKLVYYKWFDTIMEAIAEEKRIKAGSRKKKIMLINGMKTEWKDLYEQIKLL